MTPAPRHHVAHLDRTLLALLNERARLAAECEDGAPVHMDDLLRRSDGPLDAQALRAIFAAIEAGCAEARP
jgi:hypothetical protein